MTSKKFYVRTLTMLEVADGKCVGKPYVQLIKDHIDKKSLFWGDINFPLFNLEQNVIMSIDHLPDGMHYIVNECLYGKQYDDQSKEPFSMIHMLPMSFYIDNNQLYANSTTGKIKKVDQSDIVICITNSTNLLKRIPYSKTINQSDVVDSELSKNTKQISDIKSLVKDIYQRIAISMFVIITLILFGLLLMSIMMKITHRC